ncbi:MAG TPA: serine hydrolase [Bacteroidales bacterium]|jgi:CubicO group peptidase (beta-lactamase class C family)|nr:serine hydrolase [Bacteroidales bacterium]
MKNFKIISLTLLLIIAAISCRNVPKIPATGTLPRSVPEAEGVSSEALLMFLDSAAASRHEFHSIMILRHGKVIAEGWWSPYAPELKHTLYSTSKSFTSTAVGFAVTEGLITVNDKVVSFFPDMLPDTVSPYLAELTVKDLLSMSVGMDPDPTFLRFNDTNWVKAFLSTPIINKPGTKFLYNSLATYMLSAIVQKVTGEKIVDYLTPRLFEPLGIEGMDWEEDQGGINTGGWGLRIRTEDMAKFGQLLLQKGKWNGEEIIPAAWVEEATTFKIQQDPDARQSQRDSSDWLQGYCYQFWRCRNNAFRADGAYGQFIIVMPEQDAVVAITAESPDMQDEINLIWKYIFPALKSEPLPENTDAVNRLQKRLASLKLDPQVAGDSPLESQINSKEYKLIENERNFETISFDLNDSLCHILLRVNGKEYPHEFGANKWKENPTGRPGPSLTGPVKITDTFKVAGSYSWKDSKTLEMVLRYIESPHHETVTCIFDKDNISLSVAPSLAFGSRSIQMKGTVNKVH